jgi:Uncharacterized protein conserved in bacteria (DUF2188)
MTQSLIITPAPGGWRVTDTEGRLPASSYATIEEADRDAREYLARHGGGQLIVREGSLVISDVTVAPAILT